MRSPIFAANWKMNLGPTEAKSYMRTFLARYARREDRTVLFFPPALTLHAVLEALRDRGDMLAGVQNIHDEEKGAFTGENSAPIARNAGARLVLVGHSERRHLFGESDEATGRKCELAVRHDLTAVLCVGETLEQRERGETEAVVARQLAAGLARVDRTHIGGMLIAYEPVWAIGTGRNATPDDASVVHARIRAELDRIGGEHGKKAPILYGGSVNRDNVRALLEAPGVDGVLVGGASLDPDGWAAIART
ncbi:MAG TPA: triose-phosphate isomerase [Gemmatimonadaceae bacterium]|nr:triose-phosphate isomerase [Gemmatimonadaceae bacterium]